MNATVASLIVGPAQHGVVILAEQLAAGGPVLRSTIDLGNTDHQLVHLHFTDRLFGSSCAASAAAVVELAHQVRAIAVTLHDLPVPADDPGRYRRRSAAYRAVAAVAEVVIVSSEHEAALLRAFAPAVRPHVIPLPIENTQPNSTRPPSDDQVAILGFVYPGKGHAETIDALAALPTRFGLTALGRAADGHDSDVRQLSQAASAHGRVFTVTGWLSDVELTARLRRAAIPLAAHRQLSASGSIGSWLAAGRRPLVPDGPYTRELEDRCPGSVTRYAESGLAAALVHAATCPDETWLAPDVRLTPSPASVIASYRRVLTEHADHLIALTP